MKTTKLLSILTAIACSCAFSLAATIYATNEYGESGRAPYVDTDEELNNPYEFRGTYSISGSATETDTVYGINSCGGAGWGFSPVGSADNKVNVYIDECYNGYGVFIGVGNTTPETLGREGQLYMGTLSVKTTNNAGRWERGIMLSHSALSVLSVDNFVMQGNPTTVPNALNPARMNGIEIQRYFSIGTLNIGSATISSNENAISSFIHLGTTTGSIGTLTGNIYVSSLRANQGEITETSSYSHASAAGIMGQGSVSSGLGGLKIERFEANMVVSAPNGIALGIQSDDTTYGTALNMANGGSIKVQGKDADHSYLYHARFGTARINGDNTLSVLWGNILAKSGIEIGAGTYEFGQAEADWGLSFTCTDSSAAINFNTGAKAKFANDTFFSHATTVADGASITLSIDSLENYTELWGTSLTLEEGSTVIVILGNEFNPLEGDSITLLSFESLDDNSSVKLFRENGSSYAGQFSFENGTLTFIPESAASTALLGICALFFVAIRRFRQQA